MVDNMDNILISVIVPIYNVAQYLNECIDSIINQTYKNLEIILVDDGSTDESGKICDEYAKKDNRIVVIHQRNQGVNLARSNGLNIAKGDYIGYVDGDDWIEPDMYEYLLGLILEYDADFVDSGYIKKNNNNNIFHYPKRDKIKEIAFNDSIKNDTICNSMLFKEDNQFYVNQHLVTKLVKRQIIQKAQHSFQERISLGEDLICTLYLIKYSSKAVLTNKYHYNYRFREGSATLNCNLSHDILEIIESLKSLYKFFSEFEYKEILEKCANFWAIYCINCVIFRLEQNGKYSLYKYPQESLLQNKNIVLYGAGILGKGFYNQFIKNQKINIVCWADKNYKNMTDYPMPITAPEHIKNYEFDCVIIAVKYKEIADKIKLELKGLGIDENKVLWEKAKSDLDWLLN